MNIDNIFDKKVHSEIVHKLESLGLGKKDAFVYLALLSFETPVGSSKIVKKTGLHGQYVYQSLDVLEQMGLIRHHLVKTRKRFVANPPARLRHLVDQKKVVADNLAKTLNDAFKTKPQQMLEIYEGKTAFVSHQFELLDEPVEGDNYIDVIGGGGDNFIAAFGDTIKNFDDEREKLSIPVRYLGSNKEKGVFGKGTNDYSFIEYRYFPGLEKGFVDTQIRPFALTITTYKLDSPTAVTIWNKEAAERYRVFFDTLWSMAKGM